MMLSILCVTNGDKHVGAFVERMPQLAKRLNAELVLGLDGPTAQSADYRKLADVAVDLPAHDVPLQEQVIDVAVGACNGEFILRLDDDEAVSESLEKWLLEGRYKAGRLFAFPRVYMWGDESHVLSNEGIYPDLQTRLGLKALMFGVNAIHAGNPNGTGTVIPYALEHHKLLVKTYEQRRAIADRYEAIRAGAGYSFTYGRYNTPEDSYQVLETKPYSDGDYSA